MIYIITLALIVALVWAGVRTFGPARTESSFAINIASTVSVLVLTLLTYIMLVWGLIIYSPTVSGGLLKFMKFCTFITTLLWACSVVNGKIIPVGSVGVWLLFGRLIPRIPAFANGPSLFIGSVALLPASDVINEFKIRATNGTDGIPVVLKLPPIEGSPNRDTGQITAAIKLALRFHVRDPRLLLPQLQLESGQQIEWKDTHMCQAANLLVAYILELCRARMVETEYTSAQGRSFTFERREGHEGVGLMNQLRERAEGFGIEIENIVLTDVKLDSSFQTTLANLAGEGAERSREATDLQTFMQNLVTAQGGGSGLDQTNATFAAMLTRSGANTNQIAYAMAIYGGLTKLAEAFRR